MTILYDRFDISLAGLMQGYAMQSRMIPTAQERYTNVWIESRFRFGQIAPIKGGAIELYLLLENIEGVRTDDAREDKGVIEIVNAGLLGVLVTFGKSNELVCGMPFQAQVFGSIKPFAKWGIAVKNNSGAPFGFVEAEHAVTYRYSNY